MKHLDSDEYHAEAGHGSFPLAGLLTVAGLVVSAIWAIGILIPILLATSVVAIGTPPVTALYRSFFGWRRATLRTRPDHR